MIEGGGKHIARNKALAEFLTNKKIRRKIARMTLHQCDGGLDLFSVLFASATSCLTLLTNKILLRFTIANKNGCSRRIALELHHLQ